MLSQFTERDDLEPLRLAVHDAVPSASRLDPYRTVSGPLDTDWMLSINRDVEPEA